MSSLIMEAMGQGSWERTTMGHERDDSDSDTWYGSQRGKSVREKMKIEVDKPFQQWFLIN